MLFVHNFSDFSKQYAAKTNAYRKSILELFKQKNWVLFFDKLWVHLYGCAKYYRSSKSLYLLSIASQSYYVITNRCVGVPRHEREVVDGLIFTWKMFLFHLRLTA